MSEHHNPIVGEFACPACKAEKGEPCTVRLDGVDTNGWSHDARIMAPVYADLRTTPAPQARAGESEGGAS